MVAGSIAGIVEHMAMFPIDTLKTRMQALGRSCSSITIWQAFGFILKLEGLAGLYRGIRIITGQPAINKNNSINVRKGHIIEWVDSIMSKGDIEDIVDPRLEQEFDKNSVWKALEIAMACMSQSSIKRLTMTQVVTELNGKLTCQKDISQLGFKEEKLNVEVQAQVYLDLLL
ncbi:hypothetical protein FNV43_RR05699 [Rhamnella rubrinervis]|uniref:Uncharacterized protein n=1 Tax=Rhamnella rubrinervis TaxID=2594499 RepID=A0A8K0HLS6_9ROSA|nr:hypothetical protein FNV43_RR05699 [Rhamnella rubrinervis]